MSRTGRPLSDVGALAREMGVSKRRIKRIGLAQLNAMSADARACFFQLQFVGNGTQRIKPTSPDVTIPGTRGTHRVMNRKLARHMCALMERISGDECFVQDTYHERGGYYVVRWDKSGKDYAI